MKKQGFTLIELMIVVAILGIAFHNIFPGLQSMLLQDKQQQKALHDAAGLTRLYGLITLELRLCGAVENADEKGVVFANNRAIKVLDEGKTIFVGKKMVKLEGRSRIWGFEKIDERTFSSQVNNGIDEIRVIWRTGL